MFLLSELKSVSLDLMPNVYKVNTKPSGMEDLK